MQSKYNKKFPDLYAKLMLLMHLHDPTFEYTSIQLNHNIKTEPHVDKSNIGPTKAISLGDFKGGGIVINENTIDTNRNWFTFEGCKVTHSTADWTGNRYSIIFYTFKLKEDTRML